MDVIKAMVVLGVVGILALTVKYAVDNVVIKTVATNAADIEIAKIKAQSDLAMTRQRNENQSRDTNDVISARKQKCLVDLKNTVGATHPSFMDLVASTCK